MARPKKTETGFRKSFFFWNEEQYNLCSTFLKLLKEREDTGNTGNIEELDQYTIKDVRSIMEADRAKAEKRADLLRQLAELKKEI